MGVKTRLDIGKNKVGGDVDLWVNDVETELKTPEDKAGFPGRISNMISKSRRASGVYQSEAYMVNLKYDVDEEVLLKEIKHLSDWLKRHPEKSIFLLIKTKQFINLKV